MTTLAKAQKIHHADLVPCRTCNKKAVLSFTTRFGRLAVRADAHGKRTIVTYDGDTSTVFADWLAERIVPAANAMTRLSDCTTGMWYFEITQSYEKGLKALLSRPSALFKRGWS